MRVWILVKTLFDERRFRHRFYVKGSLLDSVLPFLLVQTRSSGFHLYLSFLTDLFERPI